MKEQLKTMRLHLQEQDAKQNKQRRQDKTWFSWYLTTTTTTTNATENYLQQQQKQRKKRTKDISIQISEQHTSIANKIEKRTVKWSMMAEESI